MKTNDKKVLRETRGRYCNVCCSFQSQYLRHLKSKQHIKTFQCMKNRNYDIKDLLEVINDQNILIDSLKNEKILVKKAVLSIKSEISKNIDYCKNFLALFEIC